MQERYKAGSDDTIDDENVANIDKRERIPETNDVYKAIVAIAEGRKVIFVNNEEMGSRFCFGANGTVTIEENNMETYEYSNNVDDSMEQYVTGILGASEEVKKAMDAVPSGCVVDYGGIEGIAKALFNTSRIRKYIDAKERMNRSNK